MRHVASARGIADLRDDNTTSVLDRLPDVALEAIPEAAVTFERFASELFVAMTPDAEF